jgi:hypothetical protein
MKNHMFNSFLWGTGTHQAIVSRIQLKMSPLEFPVFNLSDRTSQQKNLILGVHFAFQSKGRIHGV